MSQNYYKSWMELDNTDINRIQVRAYDLKLCYTPALSFCLSGTLHEHVMQII